MSAAFLAIEEVDDESRTILGLYGMTANGKRPNGALSGTPAWSNLSRRRDRQRKKLTTA
ncbi:MAG: hypothetical protein KAI28_00890 [Sphingomonadales bacterium]|nr:hypothetical protein [Sphingomonadales bacterium]